MLADIGLTRGDLRDAYSEPVWRDPTAILVSRAHERRINRRRVGIGLAEKTFDAPSIVPACRRYRRPHRLATRSDRRDTAIDRTELGLADLPRRPPSIRTFSSPLRSGPRARRPSRRALFFCVRRLPGRPSRARSRPCRRERRDRRRDRRDLFRGAGARDASPSRSDDAQRHDDRREAGDHRARAPVRPARPAAPNCVPPSHTNGIVPSVARPQLNTLDHVGKPRLLKAALATKVAPTNSQVGAT